MIFYKDTDDPVTMENFALRSEAVAVFEWDIEGRAGYHLQATAVANVTVEARPAGELTWTDLESSSIDLSLYIGIRRRFEIRLTAGVVPADQRQLFEIFAAPLA